MNTIEIKGGSRVVVGMGLLARLAEFVPEGRRMIIVTDPNVEAIYGNAMGACERIVIPTGEEHKTLATVGEVYRRLIDMGADRGTFLVGVGGGIVTDVTGFVASTYMRGVDFGFVATSLLAQVDASVGGKNGVNVDGFKNMAGVFRQPAFVLCDVSTLQTLPPREFRAGLAEMIKAGIIGSPSLFEVLENNTPESLLSTPQMLAATIFRAVKVKARIVEADETERGERRKLNLGHTLGHAIEKLTRRYNHGEAVAIGIVWACRISVAMGLMDEDTAGRIEAALVKAGLPVRIPAPGESRGDGAVNGGSHDGGGSCGEGGGEGCGEGCGEGDGGELAREKIAAAIAHDKKSEGSNVWFVLPRRIGDVEVRKLNVADAWG